MVGPGVERSGFWFYARLPARRGVVVRKVLVWVIGVGEWKGNLHSRALQCAPVVFYLLGLKSAG